MSTYTQDITHLIGKINTNLPDNDTQAITAARIRDAMGAVAYNYDLYVLKTDLDTAGYVTASALSGYATQDDLQTGMQSVLDDSYAYVVEKISDIPVIDPSLYVSKTELSEMGYITDNDLPDMSAYVSQDDLQSALEPYVTESQLQEAGYVTESQLTSMSYATKTYVADYVTEHTPTPDLSAYVTKTELSEAGYLTAVPSEYVTESQLQSTLTAYITDTELSSMGYITEAALGDYVTETELSQAGYVTQSQLSANSYVTETNMIQAMEYYASTYYVSKDALDQASYVSQNELSSMGYITTIPSEYVTESQLQSTLTAYVTDTELSNIGYVTQTDLSAMSYATTSDLSSKQDTLVSGTNIKTINNESLLGSGDITIQAGGTPDYSHVLKFTAAQANSSVTLNRVGTDTSLANAVLQYSTDNGTNWTDYTLGTSIALATINDSVMFKGTNTTMAISYSNYHQFVMTGKIKSSGDVTSIFNETGGDITLSTWACYNLFKDCTSLTTPPALPSTTLVDYCYSNMFYACTSLTEAPELPATTLGNNCYENMFSGCTSLTEAPELPATTLLNACYNNMFRGCTSLTKAPELPSTNIVRYCYNSMFYGCTSLTKAPELPAMTLADNCYGLMFYGCTSLTTAPELPATSLAYRCYSEMFERCTSLTSVPIIAATSLANQCYYNMFNGCSNLKYVKAMFTTTPSTSYMANWLNVVASNGVFVMNANATWDPEQNRGSNGVPSGWTVYKAVAIDTDDVPESYVEDEGMTLQVVNGIWTKVTGGGGGGDMSAYVTKTELSSMGYLTTVPSEYVTETELSSMGYATQQLVNDTATFMQTILTDANIINVDPGTGTVTTYEMATETYVADYVSQHAPTPDLSAYVTKTELSGMSYATTTYVETYYATNTALGNKQDTLVSGTNIKTINNESLLGNGNIDIQGGGGGTPDYSHVLKFTATQASSSVTLNRVGTDTSLANAVLKYSTDGGANWTNYTLSTTITLAAVGDSVMFKGTNTTMGINTSNYHQFAMTGKIKASGDVTSLLNETGGDVTIPTNGCYYLFRDCSSLTIAPKLPSTTLESYCYSNMFYNCTSLTTAPELPATTLGNACYAYMFYNCTSLTTAPALPATTMGTSCYAYMFYNCTSLKAAPELPATTLARYCYQFMFAGCSKLINARVLPATTLATGCYLNMFYNCTSLTTAPALPATTLVSECYSNMFQGCTSLVNAPVLPAITLASYCYSNMFNGCTNLKYVKAMFTTTPSNTYTTDWLKNVSSTGTFVKSSSATWTTTGTNAAPVNWTKYKAVAVDTDDLPESYVQDNGKGLQVVNGVWEKVSGLLTSANLVYDSTTNTLTINV